MNEQSTIYQLCMAAFMAAVMCILAPMSIPIGDIPVSLATFVVCLSAYLLGPKLGTLSCVVYLLLGLAGLPVFSGYSAGVAKLTGPTGGYLIGYLFLAFISGTFIRKSSYAAGWSAAGMIIGSAVMYLLGTAWYVVLMKCSAAAALAVCVQPFLIFDLLKIALAVFIGQKVRRQLLAAGLISKI